VKNHLQERVGLFARIPVELASRLERAAAASGAGKGEVVAGLIASLPDPAGHQSRGEGGATVEDVTKRPLLGRYSFELQDSDEVLDLSEAAELLRLDPRLIEQLAADGQIPSRRIEDEWRFWRQALLEWLKG
jgi:excisionase family DNA binding protein